MLGQDACERIGGPTRRERHDNGDGSRRIGLCPRREWPYNRSSPDQRDEFAPSHSITSSARASSVAGTSRPSALAAERLMTSSNLVDCATGKSTGLAPLRMRAA